MHFVANECIYFIPFIVITLFQYLLTSIGKVFLSKTLTTSYFLQLNRKFKTSCYDVYNMQIVLKQPVQSNFLSFILNLHFFLQILKYYSSSKSYSFFKFRFYRRPQNLTNSPRHFLLSKTNREFFIFLKVTILENLNFKKAQYWLENSENLPMTSKYKM